MKTEDQIDTEIIRKAKKEGGIAEPLREVLAESEWKEIVTAPMDGTRIIGRKIVDGDKPETHVTWYGKTSHVPIYGWNHGEVENLQLWTPTHWRRFARAVSAVGWTGRK